MKKKYRGNFTLRYLEKISESIYGKLLINEKEEKFI